VNSASRFDWLRSALQIQDGEGQAVGLLVALYFVLALACVFVQTMAFGLFVAAFGSQGLPLAYVSIAILASVAALAYLKLSEHVSVATLLTINLSFLGAGCVLFWLGLASPLARGFIFLLPLWFQVLINLANLAVWSLAGRIFDVRQGKRLFALVGAGNWIANIIGGFLVPLLIGWIGTRNLLLCAAISVGGGLGLLRLTTCTREPWRMLWRSGNWATRRALSSTRTVSRYCSPVCTARTLPR
jgi:ATP:ADP antiporter, AAA family